MDRKTNNPHNRNGSKSTERGKGRASHSNKVAKNTPKPGGASHPPVFYLTIPCKQAEKPDGKQPLYIVETNRLGGPESAIYECRDCGMEFRTRKAWAKHSGMVTNIMATCSIYDKPGDEETDLENDEDFEDDEFSAWG